MIKNKQMKNNSLLFSSILFILIASSCSSPVSNNPNPAEPAVNVQTMVLTTGSQSAPVTIPGQLLSYNSVDLYAKENGYVKTLYADIGTKVKKGQLLVVLEAPELLSQYHQAQADMDTRLATYKGSRDNYDRLYRTSQTPGTISPNDMDLALARAQADSAQWKAAESSFHQTEDLLSYLEIRAPFDGVITVRNISPGAYVGPADKNSGKPLMVLQELDRLRLTMNVTEGYIGFVNNRDSARFTVRGLPGLQFTAYISRKAGGLDAQTRTEQVELDVDNRDHLLLPQMYADIHLTMKEETPGFDIPGSALVTNAQRVFVIRVKDRKAVWVDVKKGLENATSVRVDGQLNAGDTLVTNATEEIKNDALLTISSVRRIAQGL
jgi:RND family efflux transporter MFP subunit